MSLLVMFYEPSYYLWAQTEGKVIRVPADYATIQDAVNVAQSKADTIQVSPGVYRESINTLGKSVRILSERGPQETVIIAPPQTAGIVCNSGETSETELRGFTIRDSFYGIWIAGASPTIVSNVIDRCILGINCGSGSPVVRANRITRSPRGPKYDQTGQDDYYEGVGIYLSSSPNPLVDGNVVEGNRTGLQMDGAGTNSLAIAVKAGNHRPLTTNVFLLLDQATLTVFNPQDHAQDPDGDPLSVRIITSPTHVIMMVSNNLIIYQPAFWLTGTNQFTYELSDGRQGFATGQVTVAIQPVNRIIAKEATLQVAMGNQVVWNLQATNVSSFPLQFIITQSPQHGLATLDQALGKLTYRPAYGYIGADFLDYIVADPQTNSAAARVHFLISPPVDANENQVADNWERAWNYLNLKDDPDGDGATNLEEYLANTNPIDPKSALRIERIVRTPEGYTALTWPSRGGVRYRILSSDSPLDTSSAFEEMVRPAAQEMDPSLPNPRMSTHTFIDTRPPSPSGLRFYRLRIAH